MSRASSRCGGGRGPWRPPDVDAGAQHLLVAAEAAEAIAAARGGATGSLTTPPAVARGAPPEGRPHSNSVSSADGDGTRTRTRSHSSAAVALLRERGGLSARARKLVALTGETGVCVCARVFVRVCACLWACAWVGARARAVAGVRRWSGVWGGCVCGCGHGAAVQSPSA